MKQLVLSILILLSCSSATSADKIRARYAPISGILKSAPYLDEKSRLFITLTTEHGSVRGVLINEKETYIVREINKQLSNYDSKNPIVFYGRYLDGFEEILEGVDCQVL